MNNLRKFALYYVAAFGVCILLFFSFKYLTKQEIFASIIGAALFAIFMVLVNHKKDKN